MFTALKKTFIKNYKDTENSSVRLKYGVTAGVFGILSNVALFAAKIVIGLISGSITVVADAVNNLSDAGSSIITVFGFKMSSKPADKEHPFGHARYEYISGFFVAFIVLAIGLLLAKSSVEKIITPQAVTVSAATYIVLALAIVMKLVQMLLYIDFGKAIDSETLRATGVDSRNDIISTAAVLVTSIVIHCTGINIDGYMGLAVSLFIVVTSVKLIKDTIDPLLGTVPSAELVDNIKKKLLSYDGVLGIHDLMVHNYGASQIYAFVHVEVDAHADSLVSHDIIDNIERDFMRTMGIHLSIHTDPVVNDNPTIDGLKARISRTVQALNPALTIHDFRMVSGPTHTNLLFDVVVPYDVNVSRATLETALENTFLDDDTKYYFVFNIDNAYVL